VFYDCIYSLSGLPADTDFSMKISKTGYLPVYINTINTNSDIIDPLPVGLFTQTEVSAWGGKLRQGSHSGLAVDAAGYLSGAVVTATSANHPSTPYAVTYFNGSSFGGSSTCSNGLVFVMNVDDGDIVTLHATKDGWSFSDTVFTAHGGTVSEGLLLGVFQEVHIENTSKYFTTLQSAHDDADSSSVNPVKAVVDDFSENLTANQSKAVTLKGGYDSGYSSIIGFISLLGVLTIESGLRTLSFSNGKGAVLSGNRSVEISGRCHAD
jgi:hypothetical protein